MLTTIIIRFLVSAQNFYPKFSCSCLVFPLCFISVYYDSLPYQPFIGFYSLSSLVPFSFIIFIYLFIYFKILVTDSGRDQQREKNLPSTGSLSQLVPVAEAEPGQNPEPEASLGFHKWMEGPKYLRHHLLPFWATNRQADPKWSS